MLNSYSVVCFTLLQFPKNVKCISLHIVYGWSVSKDCMVILLSSGWKKFNHLVGYWLKTELINVKVKEKVMVTFCKNYSFFDVLAYFHNKWITHKLKLLSIPYWGETNHDEFLSLMAQVFKNVTAADLPSTKKLLMESSTWVGHLNTILAQGDLNSNKPIFIVESSQGWEMWSFE